VASRFLERARKRARSRIPPRAARYASSPKPSPATLLAYRRALRNLAARYADAGRETLFPVLGEFAAEADSSVRTDARGRDGVIRSLRRTVVDLTKPARLRRLTRDTASRSERHARAELQKLGIRLKDTRPELAPLIERWRERNVSLIRSLFGRQLSQLEKLLARGEGLSVSVLRDRIEERFGVTESKADLLARDQTLKLNGQLTERLQISTGIEEYVWTTSGDERVRDSHAALDSTRQRWDTPPVVSDDGRSEHPGGDYQCRCTAFPVLPELEER